MATIKDLKRFCNEQDGCMACELARGCADGIENFPDNADDIVDKWVKEHLDEYEEIKSKLELLEVEEKIK